jgi:cardiolipin synthase
MSVSEILAIPAVEYGLGLLYLAIAASVTADVLLKKSDVRGALGWIAAAWLSPILGGALYFLFGINRVTRRALGMTPARSRSRVLSRSPARRPSSRRASAPCCAALPCSTDSRRASTLLANVDCRNEDPVFVWPT